MTAAVGVHFDREWAMPSAWTFTIPPIRGLLMEEGAFCGGIWADPFAGNNSPAAATNDLNPDTAAQDHMDALEWLKARETEAFDGVLYDPPYSYRQASEEYSGFGKTNLVTNSGYWLNCQDEVARICKPGGKVICFGWNSGGVGINRGFELYRVLLVPHGGHHNDTIVTVESKIAGRLL